MRGLFYNILPGQKFVIESVHGELQFSEFSWTERMHVAGTHAGQEAMLPPAPEGPLV